MGTRDPRVDAYIARAAEFAKPILVYLREIVHDACPTCEETMKWNSPHFMYKGMLCAMSAFKAHCAFGFWKGSLVVENGRSLEAMGNFGRITRVADLPPKRVIARYVKEAMRLNDEGVTSPARRRPTRPKKAIPMQPDLAAALRRNRKAAATFEAFSPSHRREYLEWITEARTAETRRRRIAQAVEWMADGKARNWKYQRA